MMIEANDLIEKINKACETGELDLNKEYYDRIMYIIEQLEEIERNQIARAFGAH